MSETKHTPGPWTYKVGAIYHEIRGPNSRVCDWDMRGRNDADAHLIAAAPDLLAACEWLLAEYIEEGCNTDHFEYIKAEAAIAKAKP